MFKKIVIFGLLTIAQVSLGMDRPHIHYSSASKRSTHASQESKQEEKIEKKITAMEFLSFAKDVFCFMGTQEFRDTLKRDLSRPEVQDLAKNCLNAIPYEYAKSYAAAYSLSLAHEIGHWAAGKLLLKEKGTIWVPPMQFFPWLGFEAFYKVGLPIKDVISHFMQNPKDILNATITVRGFYNDRWESCDDIAKLFPKRSFAAMLAAGPISGFIASYLLLKGNTFLNIYEKNGNDVQQALKETQKQSLFNQSQNFFLQIIAAVKIHQNLFSNLYPWGNQPTRDGDRMFDVLDIKNPRPLLRKTIGMSLGTFTFCALGKAIFDAWTK